MQTRSYNIGDPVTVQVLEGSEPNEHGTWQYGRGGWCDGQEVQAFSAALQ